MGADNQPKHRQHARALAIQTKKNKEGLPHILVLCEGGKTEKLYLEELRVNLRIATARIEILGLGYDPSRLLQMAEAHFAKTPIFDHVFLVFDRDEHAHFDEVVAKCQTLRFSKPKRGGTVPVRIIPSDPCFELWLLLHFQENRAALSRTEALAKLKKYLPDYEKAKRGTYAATKRAVAEATKRARAMEQSGNPSTRVHELVEFLLGLKPKPSG